MCQKTLVREEQIAIVPNNDYKGNQGRGGRHLQEGQYEPSRTNFEGSETTLSQNESRLGTSQP